MGIAEAGVNILDRDAQIFTEPYSPKVSKPFRLDPVAALSYFVSGNTAFPEDKGFALKPWTGVRFENNGVLLEGSTALAQGNYFFTDTDGKETKVEYTFGYFR